MVSIRIVGRKQRLLDLLRSEEGNVNRSKALTVGALVFSSALAQLLVAPEASACTSCEPTTPCTVPNQEHCAFIGCTWACGGGTLSCYKC